MSTRRPSPEPTPLFYTVDDDFDGPLDLTMFADDEMEQLIEEAEADGEDASAMYDEMERRSHEPDAILISDSFDFSHGHNFVCEGCPEVPLRVQRILDEEDRRGRLIENGPHAHRQGVWVGDTWVLHGDHEGRWVKDKWVPHPTTRSSPPPPPRRRRSVSPVPEIKPRRRQSAPAPEPETLRRPEPTSVSNSGWMQINEINAEIQRCFKLFHASVSVLGKVYIGNLGKRTLGRTKYHQVHTADGLRPVKRDIVIAFNRRAWPLLLGLERLDTIRHEAAHAIHVLSDTRFREKGHGPEWKAIAKRVGAQPEAMAPLSTSSAMALAGVFYTSPYAGYPGRRRR